MIHIYKDNKSSKTIILLHGTGADEYDLLPIAEIIDKNANILSIRGNVNENGMNRYFKRFGMGSYDLESFELESKNLNNAILSFSKKYNFDLKGVFVVGFSNGANIAQGLIQDYPNLVKNFVLLSPDYINKDKGIINPLENTNVYISSAKNDPYAKFSNIELLIDQLETKGANVDLYIGSGHRIEKEALLEVINWYNNISV